MNCILSPNRKLYDVMTKGSGDARTQPLYFLITTAGNDENSICYQVHQKAIDIMKGRKHDPRFYPVIYGAGRDEDWSSPEVWKKANPLWVSRSKWRRLRMPIIQLRKTQLKKIPSDNYG
jgi:phage terminase large subunit-like protein